MWDTSCLWYWFPHVYLHCIRSQSLIHLLYSPLSPLDLPPFSTNHFPSSPPRILSLSLVMWNSPWNKMIEFWIWDNNNQRFTRKRKCWHTTNQRRNFLRGGGVCAKISKHWIANVKWLNKLNNFVHERFETLRFPSRLRSNFT